MPQKHLDHWWGVPLPRQDSSLFSDFLANLPTCRPDGLPYSCLANMKAALYATCAAAALMHALRRRQLRRNLRFLNDLLDDLSASKTAFWECNWPTVILHANSRCQECWRHATRTTTCTSTGAAVIKVIVFASAKGGVGKTTLATHLAVEAERAGVGRVALADTDPQGSLNDWYKARAAETPVLINAAAGLAKAVKGCRDGGFNYLIIDTPPSATVDIGKVIAVADLCIVPVRPSPNDLRAVGRTVDLVKAAKKPFLFILNQVNAAARITLQASGALSKHGPVAETAVASRVGFAMSMTDGRTASEIEPSSKSAAEIKDLWRETAALAGEGA